jgi:hypothetical protein
MPNVRIEYYYIETDYQEYDGQDTVVNAPIDEYSEWGDITEKELDFLYKHLSFLHKGTYRARIVVATAINTPQVRQSIEQIKQELLEKLEIQKQEEKLRKERLSEIQKKAEEKTRLKKLKQLEKLKKELEI